MAASPGFFLCNNGVRAVPVFIAQGFDQVGLNVFHGFLLPGAAVGFKERYLHVLVDAQHKGTLGLLHLGEGSERCQADGVRDRGFGF